MAESPRPAPSELTPAEVRTLQECAHESFWGRSVPIGIPLSLAAFFGVKAGYFKPNRRFGPWPKVLLAWTAGWLIGKLSYTEECMNKIMKLPNSPMAEELRRQRNRGPPKDPNAPITKGPKNG